MRGGKLQGNAFRGTSNPVHNALALIIEPRQMKTYLVDFGTRR